ncbi:16S rRNA (cytidine(1402)-2'-O)-methyltransferase [Plebeiibacterium sediminum]|uniref:Ribosomal RNA small subunit methyltransferase I n=1 Tax=Plebeiibacterium sediminum TaxID=2992112 RepID=A0AAE3M3J3_9BACT|nr:16S rRNA (cytidine(1402)-2'-O)-methyltransferase [Plebeiobacterium sediminum]MCW3786351.1 16S rRNA (cytidine(1402)-2'-O)-methyltransferase [Plebeiobacterium sediminum]
MAKLYIIPTPIGNLEDMTLRALRILKEVDFILAEDTRKTGFLLKHFEIEAKMYSHHKFNEHKTSEMIVQRIMAGENCALVSDAGTPAISDPGYLLVKHAVDEGVDVECLPGATAFVPALVNSGLPNERFCFEGFLPQKKGRQKRLQAIETETRTMIFYESPFRLVKMLEQLAEVLGEDRKASVSRELTKIHEENARGTLKELIDHFNSKTVKGEIVIIVDGLHEKVERKKGNKYKDMDDE